MIGEDGLEEELELVGIRCVKEDHRPAAGMTEDDFRVTEPDSEVGLLDLACFWAHGSSLAITSSAFDDYNFACEQSLKVRVIFEIIGFSFTRQEIRIV